MIEDCDVRHCIVYAPDLVNLYGCQIGSGTTIAPFVEIQRGAVIGAWSKVCSHTFICSRVTIGDRVFVGHGVMFTNDFVPCIGGPAIWGSTIVENDVSIGSGAVILPVRIGFGAIVGAGAVVTRDVPQLSIVVGNPARVVRQFSNLEERNAHSSARYHPLAIP